MSERPTKEAIIAAVNEIKTHDWEMAALVGFRMLARYVGDADLISLAYSLLKPVKEDSEP
jgi:hypothetical protein